MRKFALHITMTNGAQVHFFGTADTADHKTAEDLRDNWQTWKATNPRAYYTLQGADGEQNIPAGDMADVRLLVGDPH